ncbi:hypothetical protein [Curtobacterium sp. MCBA15_012]|uniref:hypothetical protein n=1 Tax=Curtobacterium sp. MCBA15_012 TaxID=1898738 RepID=UPI00111348C5|nr:hypothetical protein [Curtobacterium sp. MCBA15_012]WIB00262.1 hypothetical protein QOL15_00825 [Curtobacterium sp. MCBA15_012]
MNQCKTNLSTDCERGHKGSPAREEHAQLDWRAVFTAVPVACTKFSMQARLTENPRQAGNSKMALESPRTYR